jgi:hypothetical protein
MTCSGVVRGGVIELELPNDATTPPEGTRVQVTFNDTLPDNPPRLTLDEWLDKVEPLWEIMPHTSNSAEILREIRHERATR